MHKKHLLFISLALAMVCACIFGICPLNVGATSSVWKVDGTQYATLQAALDDAAGKTWAAGDELIIEITATEDQTVKVVDGILFGVKTIFRADHTRLPIVIKGGSLKLDPVTTGEVACANSYRFTALQADFDIYDIKFFAGSGEVAFVACKFTDTTSKCHFYADSPSAKPFENWKSENAEAAKVDGLVKTSLSFDGTCYHSAYPGVASTATYQVFDQFSGYVAVVGGLEDFSAPAVKASDLSCEIILKDGGELKDVSMRDVAAFSPVKKLTMTLQGPGTMVDSIFGMGRNYPKSYKSADGTSATARQELCIEYPPCDAVFNLDGITAMDRTFFLCCAKLNGNLTVNIKNSILKSHNLLIYQGIVYGDLTVVMDDVSVAETSWGVRSGEVYGNYTTTFKGGTHAKTLHTSIGGIFKKNVETHYYEAGADTHLYMLGQGSKVEGNVTNHIYKGFEMAAEGVNVYATGNTNSASTIQGNLTTVVTGGKFASNFAPIGRNTTVQGDATATVEFASDDNESYIAGYVNMGFNKTTVLGNSSLTLKNCKIGGDVNAFYGLGSTCKGNASLLIDGAAIGGNVAGCSGGVVEGNVEILVKSGTLDGNLYASGMPVLDGETPVGGSVAGKVSAAVTGGTFGGIVQKQYPEAGATTVSGENTLSMEGSLNIKGFASLKPTSIPAGKTLTLNQIEAWNTTINYIEVAEALKASVKTTTASAVKGTAIEGTKDGIYTITGTETPVIPEPEPTPDESTTTTTVAPTTGKPTTTTGKPTTTTAVAGDVTTAAPTPDPKPEGFPYVIVIAAAAVVAIAAVLLIVFCGKIFKKK